MLVLAVPTNILTVSLRIKPRCERHNALAVLGVLVEYDANDFCLVFVDFQMPLALFVFDELIAIGCLSAIPLSLAGLLLAPSHRLNKDIFTFHFCERRHERNHHLAHLGFAVDAILDADEVCSVILHKLKRRKCVCCVTPETAQLEHKNIIHANTGFYLFHHLLEVWTPGDVLA